jgi:methionine-rich copper-binding protein CopC
MKSLKLLLSSLLLLVSGVLRAHTHLEAAVPADGAVLKAAPAAIELTFGEDVQLLKVEVAGASGPVALDFAPSATATKTFSLALPALAPSAYTVNWTVLGADGHRVDGHFAFTVDPAATESAGAAHHEH